MPWPAIAAGAGAVIGGLLGLRGQQEANQANIDVARENREWQGWMSNTAHQREVTDLKSAGLNPILSVNAGASTPTPPTPVMQNAMEPLAGAIGSAVKDTMAFKMQMEKQGEEIALMKKQGEAAAAQAQKTLTEKKVLEGDVPLSEIKKNIFDAYSTGAKTLKENSKQLKENLPEKLRWSPRMFKP